MKPIIFVGGKGGVGKTTISASIASKLALESKRTLIVSTDPAHSLGDALDMKLSHKIKKVRENLDALELDPIKITDEHFKNIEETLKSYSKPEMFAKIKQHLELSKDTPGAQEAALLEQVCRLLTDRKDYDHIVFDTAPTGHTVRLLSLPYIMSAWSEGLMRRQQERDKIADAAKVFWQKKENYEHNPFAPSKELRWKQALKRLDERKELFLKANEILKNPNLTSIYLVMIPQALPLFETLRAKETFDKFDMQVEAIFINQIIPKTQSDSFWQTQIKKQDEILAKFHDSLPNSKKIYIMLSQEDLRGVDKLANLKFQEQI
ncbi:ArsA family ATPase [Campylobacter sp.]|uniref:ArsA family ATPase n=1 Tax=Campylobacter sp. TaxID=205 RepID=UPI00270B3E7F|nr:ArsA family ATPase [Campylobacter sp.]